MFCFSPHTVEGVSDGLAEALADASPMLLFLLVKREYRSHTVRLGRPKERQCFFEGKKSERDGLTCGSYCLV